MPSNLSQILSGIISGQQVMAGTLAAHTAALNSIEQPVEYTPGTNISIDGNLISLSGTVSAATKVSNALTFIGNTNLAYDGSAARQINAGDNIGFSISEGTLTISAANNSYQHPDVYDQSTNGLYKITVASGHVTAATAVEKADITALGIPAENTVYTHPDVYDQSTNGLYKITVASGHVTNTTAVTSGDLPSHTHAMSDITGVDLMRYQGSATSAAILAKSGQVGDVWHASDSNKEYICISAGVHWEQLGVNFDVSTKQDKIDGGHMLPISLLSGGMKIFNGQCSTAAGTGAKTVSIQHYDSTISHLLVVEFENGSCTNATLNVSDSGARTIKFAGYNSNNNSWNAGDILTMIYNGADKYEVIAKSSMSNGVTYTTLAGAAQTLTMAKDTYYTASDLTSLNLTIAQNNTCITFTTGGTFTYNVTSTFSVSQPFDFYPNSKYLIAVDNNTILWREIFS